MGRPCRINATPIRPARFAQCSAGLLKVHNSSPGAIRSLMRRHFGSIGIVAPSSSAWPSVIANMPPSLKGRLIPASISDTLTFALSHSMGGCGRSVMFRSILPFDHASAAPTASPRISGPSAIYSGSSICPSSEHLAQLGAKISGVLASSGG
jgi:hypothetical protein